MDEHRRKVGVLYRRVSDEDSGEHGLSLGAQLRRLRVYAAQNEWAIAGEYTDIMTGKRQDRPEYVAMLAHVRKLVRSGAHVAVIVARVDRFGRGKLSEQAAAYEEIVDAGAEFHAVDQGGKMATLQFGLQATLARHEVDQMGERIRNVIKAQREQGWWIPSRVPYGYRARPRTPAEYAAGAPGIVLEADPVTAPVVRRLFRMVAHGGTRMAALAHLHALAPEARGRWRWTATGVHGLLSNRVYLGQQADGTLGQWPALVDEGHWRAVQAYFARQRAHPRREGTSAYLLTGLIYCPKCGARCAGAWTTAQGRRYPRYACQAAQAGTGRCWFTCHRAQVDQDVLRQVEPIIEASIAELRAWADAALRRQEHSPDAGARKARRSAIQAQLEHCRAGMVKLGKKLAFDEISQEVYSLTVEALEADYQAAQSELAALAKADGEGAGMDIETALARIGNWRVRWRAGDVEARRSVLAEFITRAEPYRDGSTWKARITWTGAGELLAPGLTHQPAPDGADGA